MSTGKPPSETDVSKVDNAASTNVVIDPAKERAIISKFDKFVLPQFCIILVLAYLDRTNIGMSQFPQMFPPREKKN